MNNETNEGRSRRQVLRAGAAGALWVAPALVALNISAAHADSASGGVKETTPPPPTTVTTTTPPPTTTTTTTPPTGGVSGSSTSAAAPARAGAGASPSALARTGGVPLEGLAVGAGLIAAGAAATYASKQMSPKGQHAGPASE